LEREQREQARQERHAARALATAAALSIQEEGTSAAGSCLGDQETVAGQKRPPLPPLNDSSPDSSPLQEIQQQQHHDNYFSRSSMTEESCSVSDNVGNVGGGSLYTPSPVINSVELADLLLEVRLVCQTPSTPSTPARQKKQKNKKKTKNGV
jgi:hypothetical protein